MAEGRAFWEPAVVVVHDHRRDQRLSQPRGQADQRVVEQRRRHHAKLIFPHGRVLGVHPMPRVGRVHAQAAAATSARGRGDQRAGSGAAAMQDVLDRCATGLARDALFNMFALRCKIKAGTQQRAFGKRDWIHGQASRIRWKTAAGRPGQQFRICSSNKSFSNRCGQHTAPADALATSASSISRMPYASTS